MDEKFVAEVKAKLLEQRQSILKSLADQSDEMKNLIKPIESGDEADMASDVIDRTMLDALGAQDSLRLQQIDAALERIRNGKYGICVCCNKEIPMARLEALPYAFLCVNCAAAQERRNR
ncbi:MAG: TraR/DksA family transcriptional regulator [Treponema sp.]|nr:TraR/DksA family transcriptional regulator [Treponema sp.]MBQ5999573.1 TraR/DksA family transcriptional regulator [Treponema sp.]